MTSSPRMRYLVPRLLILLLAGITGPSYVQAKGPQPKPDYTIKTIEETWTDGMIAFSTGTWTVSGIVQDSGILTGDQDYWHSYLYLESDLGSMLIVLRDSYWGSSSCEDCFFVDGGTGIYESWTGSVGYWRSSGQGHTLKGFLLEP